MHVCTALGFRRCMAIVRCLRVRLSQHPLLCHESRGVGTDHVLSYGVAVMARPRKMVWFLTKYFLRLEKIFPFVTRGSWAILESDITMKSWLPKKKENNGPCLCAHLCKAPSGSFPRKAWPRQGPACLRWPALS